MNAQRDIREVLEESIADIMTLGLTREEAKAELVYGLEEKIRQEKKQKEIDRSL